MFATLAGTYCIGCLLYVESICLSAKIIESVRDELLQGQPIISNRFAWQVAAAPTFCSALLCSSHLRPHYSTIGLVAMVWRASKKWPA
ncbi:hypothetical protein B0H66DRAFT_318481 [Apodospora peruviana]|uniref:Uncharacterized protein n=1 Tax=Apodospora peruviana TaxID=516989 RepID=A0AAE0M0H0_9PEZI|nr:hypothetical protein B0H66DRAFT_318481 [Apodospora peruviana]